MGIADSSILRIGLFTEPVRIASKLAPTVGDGGALVEAPAARVSFFVGASLLAIMDPERMRFASKLAPTVKVWRRVG